MDVWLDSGAMPFAQDHYLSENKKDIAYPADFISEAIDQTRGWFYTLHAVGSIMGKGKAYKNVICLGHILDEKGKKMSKSLGNIVDPWTMIDKYGVDTLRLWMYSVNQPGESKNFDEKTVIELNRQIFGLLYNVLTFYELYRDQDMEKNQYIVSPNVLDKWILKRFNILLEITSLNLDNYKLLEPVRAIRDFVDDLSTWYLRRSRERIKEGDKNAKMTLYFILKNLSKLIAPFAPFTAEDIWQKLKNEKDTLSVHLSDWSFDLDDIDIKFIEEMSQVRKIVKNGLQLRQKSGIPVRQPLSKLSIVKSIELSSEYEEIIKDELNIKEIDFIEGSSEGIYLDTNITEELKQEGICREFIRAIQDIRKKMGLNPLNSVLIRIENTKEVEDLINKFKKDIVKAVGASDIEIGPNNGEEIKLSEFSFKVEVIK
jgi:isoleucyl-tRNA synthetase